MATGKNVDTTSLDTLSERIRGVDEKYLLLLAEAEKRNSQRFDAQQAAVQAALLSAERAVAKAETASERRFESVNEFRQTLSDQTSTFVTRNENGVQYQSLSDKLDTAFGRASEKQDIDSKRIAALERQIGEIGSRGTGRNDVWIILTTVFAIALAAGSLFFHLGGK